MQGEGPLRIDDAIRAALVRLPWVEAAILFGSRARGVARPESDIDVAVLLRPPAGKGDRYQLMRDLIQALGRELASDRLDLVVLEEASPALAFQVLAHGRVIFAKDPARLHRFRVRAFREHGDREEVERLFQQTTKERAQGVLRRG